MVNVIQPKLTFQSDSHKMSEIWNWPKTRVWRIQKAVCIQSLSQYCLSAKLFSWVRGLGWLYTANFLRSLRPKKGVVRICSSPCMTAQKGGRSIEVPSPSPGVNTHHCFLFCFFICFPSGHASLHNTPACGAINLEPPALKTTKSSPGKKFIEMLAV